MEWAEAQLREHVRDAEALLAPYGPRASILTAAAHFIADRKS
jgi:farnesyl diphosphate synthase